MGGKKTDLARGERDRVPRHKVGLDALRGGAARAQETLALADLLGHGGGLGGVRGGDDGADQRENLEHEWRLSTGYRELQKRLDRDLIV